MPSDTVADVIGDLEKYYSKKLNADQRQFYADQLAKLDEIDLCRAAVWIKQKEVFFPTVNTIQHYAFDECEQRLKKEKATAPDFSSLQKGMSATEHGREAFKLIIAFSENKMTRQEYLAGMYEMEKKYPGVGWKQNANELKQFWEDEPRRELQGRRYLELIWELQDKNPNFPK